MHDGDIENHSFRDFIILYRRYIHYCFGEQCHGVVITKEDCAFFLAGLKKMARAKGGRLCHTYSALL